MRVNCLASRRFSAKSAPDCQDGEVDLFGRSAGAAETLRLDQDVVAHDDGVDGPALHAIAWIDRLPCSDDHPDRRIAVEHAVLEREPAIDVSDASAAKVAVDRGFVPEIGNEALSWRAEALLEPGQVDEPTEWRGTVDIAGGEVGLAGKLHQRAVDLPKVDLVDLIAGDRGHQMQPPLGYRPRGTPRRYRRGHSHRRTAGRWW